MARLTSTLAALAAGASVSPVILVRLAFPSGTLYLADQNCSYGGNTYSADGTLQNISPIIERADSKVGGLTITLAATSAVRTAIVGDALQFADAQILLGFLSSGTLSDAESLGTFLMSHAEYDITSGTVGLICEPVAIRLLRANMVMASNADQQKRYSGDTFFTHTAALDEKEIEWGGVRGMFEAAAPSGYREGVLPRYRER